MAVNPILVSKTRQERYYIDITTNGINTTTGVIGPSNNEFTANIQSLTLDLDKQYTVEVHSFNYQNSNLGPPIIGAPQIYPIILCDLAENIRVVNTNSSILYKSNIPASDTLYYERDKTNNDRFVLALSNTNVKTISFQIVRSDNGQPFPLISPVQLTLLIKS